MGKKQPDFLCPAADKLSLDHFQVSNLDHLLILHVLIYILYIIPTIW